MPDIPAGTPTLVGTLLLDRHNLNIEVESGRIADRPQFRRMLDEASRFRLLRRASSRTASLVVVFFFFVVMSASFAIG